MQPLPPGFRSPHPNVNFPGGLPSLHAPAQDFDRERRKYRRRRGSGDVIYYAVPYYIPYSVYQTEVVAGAAAGASGAAPNSAAPRSPDSPGSSSLPAERPRTLLAFKDHTVLIVVDYWLEGDWLYYALEPGQRLSVPLDRLDQPLTQQLNRERGVAFVLEAR
ncbi:MAG TPA: hypothetical protein VNN17_09745 [Terriglobia bacterium]|nr:hypothetical protein [Terriglobia bacterium]